MKNLNLNWREGFGVNFKIMKINIEIPDWVKDEQRGIYIMAGSELVASKMPWEDFWKVKVSRCNMCGKCCKDCRYLNKDNMCNLKAFGQYSRPFDCCIAEPRSVPGCTSRMEIVK